VFLASSGRRTDESDEPLVDAGAVVRTVLGEGHDVGVIEGVDDAASNRFLRLRDHRKGHLIDVSHVHEGEALIGIGVVEEGATNGRRGVDSEELLEAAVRGGDPRGAADGEGLEESLSALLANALTVLLSGSKHRGNQKVRKRRGGSTLCSNANANANVNEEKVRGTSSFGENDGLGAVDAEFGRSERSETVLGLLERAHGDREARGAAEGLERRRTYSRRTVYSDSSRGSRKK
jgi:hypothetical protein